VGAEVFARGGSLCEGTSGQYLCVQGGDAVSGVGGRRPKNETGALVGAESHSGQGRTRPWDPTELFVHRDPGGK
jgi:hypothetical protein